MLTPVYSPTVSMRIESELRKPLLKVNDWDSPMAIEPELGAAVVILPQRLFSVTGVSMSVSWVTDSGLPKLSALTNLVVTSCAVSLPANDKWEVPKGIRSRRLAEG